MKILLDTHVWIWYLEGDRRLSQKLRKAISSVRNELWISPISVWEVALLAERGRLRFEPDTRTWIRTALAKINAREAPLTSEVSLISRELQLLHDDPADRFIAATAAVYELRLATEDERLRTLTRLVF